MFQGLRTVIYQVGDLEQAKAWYSTVLGVKPYFDEPFYVGFNVGGFELGLQPDTAGLSRVGNSVITYWGVSQIEAAFKRLLELGATVQAEIQDVGGDIRVASVIDPFGNIVGIIENPHFSLESAKP